MKNEKQIMDQSSIEKLIRLIEAELLWYETFGWQCEFERRENE